MKKLLGILVMGLLLISCSKNKEDVALENCATKTMDISNNEYLWENEAEFIALDNEQKMLSKQKSVIKDKFDRLIFNEEEEINQYYLTNPSPPEPNHNLLIIGSDEQKTKNQVQWEKEFGIWSYWKAGFNEHQQNIEKKYISEKKSIHENLTEKSIELSETISRRWITEQKKANEKIAKMNLSEKKKLNGFLDSYRACEQFYEKNKKTFILQFGD